jgi:hypothetical protein
MKVEVRHFVPGRVRIYAPELFREEQSPDQLLQRIAAAGSILKVRSNRDCCSVVIEFHRDEPGPIADLVCLLRLSISEIPSASGINGLIQGSNSWRSEVSSPV